MIKKLLAVTAVLLAGVASVAAQTANANYPETQLSPSYGVDTGAANVLAASPAFGCPTALTTGIQVRVKPANANTTTTPTLNWCGLGAKTIMKFGTSAVAASDLTTSAIALLFYDGTEWQLANPQTASSLGTVTDGGGTTTNGALSTGTASAHTQAYNTNDIVAAGGNFSTYDGMSTAGVGLVTVLGVSDVTAQSASQTTVNLLASTPAAGHYLVRIYLDQNAVCTTGTGSVYATVSWTDATHAHSAQTVPLTLANTAVSTANGYIDAAIPLWSATASAITYTTTYAGCTTGTGTYDLHAEVERTN